jgi:hypothetical protein
VEVSFALYNRKTLVPGYCLGKQTFVDEFEGPGGPIDSSKWKFQSGGGGWGHEELQYYKVDFNLMLIVCILLLFRKGTVTVTRRAMAF